MGEEWTPLDYNRMIRAEVDPIAPVGGVVMPVNKPAVFAPYLALFGVIAAAAIVVAAPWKKRET